MPLTLKPGMIFGRWTVISKEKSSLRNEKRYLCKCSCGITRVVIGYSLRNGTSKSCGCTKATIAARTFTTHGLSDTPLHKIWCSMRSRCKSGGKDYTSYGSKGIKVCKSWDEDFLNFYRDMAEGYADGLSIDRIDNNGDYSPENCRWATPKQQVRNRAKSANITFKGKTMHVKDWAKLLGLGFYTLYHRIFMAHWPIEEAMTSKIHKNGSDRAKPTPKNTFCRKVRS